MIPRVWNAFRVGFFLANRQIGAHLSPKICVKG